MAKIKGSSFVAIGVGRGDAFFLRKGSFTVLIDGGSATIGFPKQFHKVTKRNDVDILVCTHNDADHARGVLGFLRSSLTCKEVWLPGSWTDRLDDLLLNPIGFIGELISNIEEIEASTERHPLLQFLGSHYSENMTRQERDNEGATSADVLSKVFKVDTEPESWHRFRRVLQRADVRFRLYTMAFAAATRIREISLAAYHKRSRIRWFEYDNNYSSGGISNFLVPLNAHEISTIYKHQWSALEYLALTIANKQSLVFLSPENDEAPAALFTADSDLCFHQPIPWSDGMIITAPHHGSEANAKAYERFSNETGNDFHVIWIRSDGNFKNRPGNSYLKACGSRFCTICSGSNYAKQDVRLTVASRRWRPTKFTRKCCCV